MTADTSAWARDYHCRGGRVVPIPTGRKGPVMTDWPHFEARGDDLPGLFGGGENVGVILDTLADVDIDCAEAGTRRPVCPGDPGNLRRGLRELRRPSHRRHAPRTKGRRRNQIRLNIRGPPREKCRPVGQGGT
jgi:hypothetical protein